MIADDQTINPDSLDIEPYKLVPYGSEILRTKTKRFDFASPPINPVELYQRMAKTLVETEGVGLAAVQVGLEYRMFVMRSDPIMGVFNPIIVDKSEERVVLDEGCLTYPEIVLKIKRPKKIRLRFTEANGETTTKIFDGMSARIIQHELMHCDGELFGDLVSRLQLERAIKKAKKHNHQYVINDFK